MLLFYQPDLKETPLIINKSDGAANYTTTDLATVQYRGGDWKDSLTSLERLKDREGGLDEIVNISRYGDERGGLDELQSLATAAEAINASVWGIRRLR